MDTTTWIILGVVFWFLMSTWSQHRPHATDHPLSCKHCGASHPSFAKFCRHCGKKLD